MKDIAGKIGKNNKISRHKQQKILRKATAGFTISVIIFISALAAADNANIKPYIMNQLREQFKRRLLDICDLQDIFGVSRNTIYNWCKQGLLKYIQIGGRKYFDADDVEAMLQQYKQTQVPDIKKQRNKQRRKEEL